MAGPFKLRSGNKSPLEFKQMGSSPAKQEAPRKKSMDPIGPRGPEGYFKTVHPDDYGDIAGATPATTETKPVTRVTSTGKIIPTGETEVVTTEHTKYKKGGEPYSKIRGIAPDTTIETSIVGPKGKQRGKTKVSESEGAGGARDYEREDILHPFGGGERTYDPKTRTIR
tara:strand:+ start:193 stop:699 length:507 start_codon:yes stop_codon:yes gene_type:complete